MKVITLEALENLCVTALLHAGMERPAAETTARVLCRTDAYGTHSHGTKNLYDYIRKIQCGGMECNGQPKVVKEGPSFASIDGGNTIGMVTGTMAMELAMEKCRKPGIACVNVTNSEHFGAAGYYAVLAAEQGLIGISMSNVDANMTIPGARSKVMGNNPFAYALPAGKYRPVFLDIALSAVASLKVVQARKDGTSIPAGWIIDKDGITTTDPSHYPEEGAMLPMAAHKGYGLALMVEALTSMLGSGAMMTQVPSWLFCLEKPNQVSHMFMCIDPQCFCGLEEFKANVDKAIETVHSAPLAKGCERLFYPGEIEWGRYEKAVKDGLSLGEDVAAGVEKLAAFAGVEVPWMQEKED